MRISFSGKNRIIGVFRIYSIVRARSEKEQTLGYRGRKSNSYLVDLGKGMIQFWTYGQLM